MRKLSKILLLSIILLLFCSIFTNPTKKEFVEWSRNNMKLNSKNIFEYSAVSLLGEAALTTKTEVNNYFIFSIFETNLNSNSKSVKTLGLFNKFIPLTSNEYI
ncbi:DUF4359 domain-containing protein [Clostridium sp. Ade.TY]|uniref:DUF4359 domain-containing protein n=1 Tax=Clostridium sp. Ade.TY TaxID=1391647 RepID=UPI0004067F3D|nr:DUF4359 domain-containing protein [Clostridium sp. Ade.TY]